MFSGVFHDLVVPFGLGIMVGMPIGFGICELRLENLKIEAVEKGKAEWKVDTRGSTTFTWKE